MDLTNIKTLTFDCYGTLIDWERGILDALRPMRSRAASARTDSAVLQEFADCESRQQILTPAMLYTGVLTEVHQQLGERWGVQNDPAEDRRFGASVGDWPAFPDAAPALAYLATRFRLAILSNVDRASFARSNAKLGVTFDAIYTAQDIGSYKPSQRNFTYLIERLEEQDVTRDETLHVAQSLYHDHVPANAAGLRSVWIDRRGDAGGWGATAAPPDDVRYEARFPSLEAFAAACRNGG